MFGDVLPGDGDAVSVSVLKIGLRDEVRGVGWGVYVCVYLVFSV